MTDKIANFSPGERKQSPKNQSVSQIFKSHTGREVFQVIDKGQTPGINKTSLT